MQLTSNCSLFAEWLRQHWLRKQATRPVSPILLQVFVAALSNHSAPLRGAHNGQPISIPPISFVQSIVPQPVAGAAKRDCNGR